MLYKGRLLGLDSLSDEDRELLDLPLIGRPSDPEDGTSPPPFPATDDVDTSPNGFPANEEAGQPIVQPGVDIEDVQITPEDIIMERRLADILIGAGLQKPNNDHQAHNIIPWSDRRAIDLRKKLSDVGIDINDPMNGIWLPKNEDADNPLGRTSHNQTYTNDYFNYLDRQFENATAEEIPGILSTISTHLENGAKFEKGVPRD